MFILQNKPIDSTQTKLTQHASIPGALVSFEGIVRKDKHDAREVQSLLYIADEALCLSEGTKILNESIKQFSLSHVLCIQRIGQVHVGESAIWIGAWSPHRDEAFKGCRYIIEEIKKRLHIWKKEFFIDGTSLWIHGNPNSLAL